MNILATLAADPNVAPALRRALDTTPAQIDQQHERQQARRFLADPPEPSAFAALEAQLDALDRRNETGDREANAVEQAREDEARDERFGSW